jgi:hypothetical protein
MAVNPINMILKEDIITIMINGKLILIRQSKWNN